MIRFTPEFAAVGTLAVATRAGVTLTVGLSAHRAG